MFAHRSSPWSWQCPEQAQGSVWALLTRAEFSPVTWAQEAPYPITEPSHQPALVTGAVQG